jgi:hypothetical protein
VSKQLGNHVTKADYLAGYVLGTWQFQLPVKPQTAGWRLSPPLNVNMIPNTAFLPGSLTQDQVLAAMHAA